MKHLTRTLFTTIVLLMCAMIAHAQQTYENLVVAGFYPYTKDYVLKPESIPLQNLTHLIYCFAGPRADGSISTETGSYHNAALVSRVHAANKKFIIMMGGGLQSGGYHAMAATQATRTIFINTLVDWCRTYGYDGVNIDWEYPGDNNKAEDRDNLTALVREMRQAFTAAQPQLGKYIEISIDVHSSLYYAQWVDFATLKSYVDWFGLMSYDYAGDWSYSIHAAHNAPLYCGPPEICDRYLSVDTGVKNLTQQLGIPASQIVMGVAFYGREFFNSALYQTPREGGGGIAHYDVAPLIGNGWTRYWDDQSKVPYLLKNSGSGFISYDDTQSLTEKANYIKQHELLGAMAWEITQDVDKVTKQQPLFSLLGTQLVGQPLDTEGKPEVSITSPTQNYVFTPGANLSIGAIATVETGFTIARVDFFRNGSLLSTDNTAPFNAVWQSVPNGKHTLYAIAYSNNGKSAQSSTINITDGLLPQVTEMFDDFNYAGSSDPELDGINKWLVIDGVSGPPSGAIYSKELITFTADPNNTSNKIMGVATVADNNPQNTRHSRIETSVMPYRNGTFAARVYFDDTPALYGDANVETFYTINSYATCNQPDLYSEADFEYLPWDAWHWERQKTMYTTTWETCEVRDTQKAVRSYEGWHDLIYTVVDGQPVKYYIDGQLFHTQDRYQPDSDVNISFANWIYQNITGANTTLRTTTMNVDWLYHAKDAILSRDDVLAKVSNFRQIGVLRKNLAGQIVSSGPVNPPPTITVTSPSNNASFTPPATIIINATASDANGTVTSVAFYNGATLLGTDTSSPYSYTWAGVTSGSYNIIVRATDNGGATAQAQVAITVTSNPPPAVSITGPANNASFNAPANIIISANASDTNGTITDVRFYNGATLLGTDTSSPYSFAWNNVTAGTYTLMAVAADNGSATTTSAPITITVIGNTPPSAAISSPANNTTFIAPATITINATASDTNGTVTSVAFYNGSTLLGTDTSTPYSFVWPNVAVGNYTLTARATDNNGAVTTSIPVNIAVNPNTPVQLQVTYRTIVEWGTGFQGEVRITNNSAVTASNWIVEFNCPHNITPIWDAVITNHTGNHYVVQGTSATQSIPANQSVVFGFIGNIASGQGFSPPSGMTVGTPGGRIRTNEMSREQVEVDAYPNPFNSSVVIAFTIANDSPVKLDILNAQGKLVATLVNEKLQEGSHRAAWDTNDSAGLYLCQLSVDGMIITKKLVKKE